MQEYGLHEAMPADNARSAASLLSATGALVLGVGIGALLGERLGGVAWPLAAIGLAAHVWGMVASRRILAGQGHTFARWESWGFWLCWVLITIGAGAAAWRLLA